MAAAIEWQHRFGPSAGAGLGHAKLIAQNVSFAQCLAACEAAGMACAAVDYVLKHGKPSPAAVEGYRECEFVKQPAKFSCFMIRSEAWHRPCVQPQTENVASLKIPRPMPPAGARSVLLVIFDDLRVIEGRYAQRFTPVSQAFAHGAITFLSAHAQTSICGPSRASFLSGRRPDITRVHWTDGHLRERPQAKKWITLPQHFRDHGYYVAAAGKLFHKMADPISLDPISWSEPECVANYPYFGQGSCPEKPDVLFRVFNTTTGCPVDAQRHPGYTFTDKHVLHKAIALLRGAAADARSGARPFWLGVGFFKPHKPHVFPAELMHRVPQVDEVPLPINSWPAHRQARMANIPELCTAPGKARLETEGGQRCAKENIRMYHAAASFTDELLGELLDELASQRLQQETLVVVMGDQGFALGEHGSWAKWTNWEVATRTPLAIRVPWIPGSAGQRISTPIELLDLYPTLAELAGVPLPHSLSEGYRGIHGRNLGKLIQLPRNNSLDGLAFSQIARCWPSGGAHDSSVFASMAQCDGIPSAEYAFMGYSMRTSTARYTEWVPIKWSATTARHLPQWDAVVARELYDHAGGNDLGDAWSERSENDNIESSHPLESAMLQRRLREHFDSTLAEAEAL